MEEGISPIEQFKFYFVGLVIIGVIALTWIIGQNVMVLIGALLLGLLIFIVQTFYHQKDAYG